jgi:hypothetical protein
MLEDELGLIFVLTARSWDWDGMLLVSVLRGIVGSGDASKSSRKLMNGKFSWKGKSSYISPFPAPISKLGSLTFDIAGVKLHDESNQRYPHLFFEALKATLRFLTSNYEATSYIPNSASIATRALATPLTT